MRSQSRITKKSRKKIPKKTLKMPKKISKKKKTFQPLVLHKRKSKRRINSWR